MLIILDLGANDGCSIKKFESMLRLNDTQEYMIYSFEPNVFFRDRLKKAASSGHVEVCMGMLGTKNGPTKLYLSQGDSYGSSVYCDKLTNKIQDDLFITCDEQDIIDFIDNLPPHDELWVKMDIEGAEYPLIQHLHAHGYIPKIDKLYIEWHYTKIPSITKEQHEAVVKMISQLRCEDWCAQQYSDKSQELQQDYRQFLDAQRSLKSC